MIRRKLLASLLLAAVTLTALASFFAHVYPDLPPSEAATSTAALFPQPLVAVLRSAVATGHSLDGRSVKVVAEDSLRPHRRTGGETESVLLPGWEVLVLVPQTIDVYGGGGGQGAQLYCLFHNGDRSVARPAGGGDAFLCVLPTRVRPLRPFYTPRLILVSSTGDTIGIARQDNDEGPRTESLNWTTLAYHSVSTADDVVVFVKGVNKKQGEKTPAPGLRCAFVSQASSAVVASTAATSSAQEVFRCPHPPPSVVESFKATGGTLRVSLILDGSNPAAPHIPTVANYNLPAPTTADSAVGERRRSLVCACTMVFNAAKFLEEWVIYHAAVGVERFFLYDNSSDDELESVVNRLRSESYDVSTIFWPWPKTQEAGFSHSAVVNRDECEWMAFIDVDEFIFSPAWSDSDRPDRSMLASLIPAGRTVGQVSMTCLEFGPSGQVAHPESGVIQGYTCRMKRGARHKSLVRLDSVADSLVNSVHHFGLRNESKTKLVGMRTARVNHYKYQAWKEFKIKFRRRVSTYVADWTDSRNPNSKDRTPGLGFMPVEPIGWKNMFCEVNDTLIRDTTNKWFSSLMDHPSIKDELRRLIK